MIRLGRIVVGAGASKNNTNTTGTPFAIPSTTKAIYILGSAAGNYASNADGGTVASPSALAAVATDFPLSASVAFAENLGGSAGAGQNWTVAVYSAAGGNFDVYAVLP